MKRIFDFVLALIFLIISAPIILLSSLLVWLNDKSNPFYLSRRVGIKGIDFKMIKIRTMVNNADLYGVDSTAQNDPRITRIGAILRRFKIDELPQFFNILIGEMSFVGPRPNVRRDINLYTKIEYKLLTIKPGITDFASIVYSDEGLILENTADPDLSYNQLIRPGKSLLGLFYVENKSFIIDLVLIFITFINIFSRRRSLILVTYLLKKIGASNKIIEIASRKSPLVPSPPPGSDDIVKKR
tara:strand:+ start:1943 stop:2668 length:726 start_codon:yes stop_codon:yes gene_type:complete